MRVLVRPILAAAVLLAVVSTPSSSAEAEHPRVAAGPLGDYGDAPEGSEAYPGVDGHFPTCFAYAAPAGTRELVCQLFGTVPGATGYIIHVDHRNAPLWIGCGGAGVGYDEETEAKINLSPSLRGEGPVDCVEGLASGASVRTGRVRGGRGCRADLPVVVRRVLDAGRGVQRHVTTFRPGPTTLLHQRARRLEHGR